MLKENIRKIVEIALAEDHALDDITSDLTIEKNKISSFEINARQELIFCGQDLISEVFLCLQKSTKFKNADFELKILAKDGDKLKKSQNIAKGKGNTRLILAAERVILNLIQHLSAISTTTNQFVKKLNNSKIKILDTRKTIPALRALQKYAVKIGGGNNHRFSLFDMILIKDNHIAAAGSVEKALILAKKSGKKIEIECDNFLQVQEALKQTPDIIMLDNMNIDQIKKSCLEIRKKSKKTKIEISGGINLNNIQNFSKLDIDFISIGYLTHSVTACDIGLDLL